MIRIRRANERGAANHGWLDTRYTFSFFDYQDPEHTGFRALRVMNEDRIAAGAGFPSHGHRDMEILTFVLSGAIAHKDSLGHGETLRPGEIQRMSAGTGIRHSEFNPSDDEPVHLYQVWIVPDRAGHAPSYEQRALPKSSRPDGLQLVASPDGRDGSVTIHQDAMVYQGDLDDGREVDQTLETGRHAWVQMLRGSADLNGHRLDAGDGAAISDESALRLRAVGKAELLVFDLN